MEQKVDILGFKLAVHRGVELRLLEVIELGISPQLDKDLLSIVEVKRREDSVVADVTPDAATRQCLAARAAVAVRPPVGEEVCARRAIRRGMHCCRASRSPAGGSGQCNAASARHNGLFGDRKLDFADLVHHCNYSAAECAQRGLGDSEAKLTQAKAAPRGSRVEVVADEHHLTRRVVDCAHDARPVEISAADALERIVVDVQLNLEVEQPCTLHVDEDSDIEMITMLLELKPRGRECGAAAGLHPQIHISEGRLQIGNEANAALHRCRRGPCAGSGSNDRNRRLTVGESAHDDASALARERTVCSISL